MIQRPLGVFVLVLLACLYGCGSNDSTTRWDGGSLVVEGAAERSRLTLQLDGSSPVKLAARSRVPLGQSLSFSATEQTGWRSEFAAKGWITTLLSLEVRRGTEVPIAAIVRSEDRTRTLAVLWCAASGAAALERLHAFLLGVQAETSVEVKDGCKVLGGSTEAPSRSHVAGLLRRVAEARTARPGGALDAGTAGPRWRLVDITPRLDGNLPMHVAAVIHQAGIPVRGAGVSFAREPHLACTAATDNNGVAGCTLYDTHGHAPHDSGSTLPPTTVTFSGRMVNNELAVPTIAVVPTPPPTRCQSTVVSADVAAGWSADCRGFASRTWTLPAGAMR